MRKTGQTDDRTQDAEYRFSEEHGVCTNADISVEKRASSTIPTQTKTSRGRRRGQRAVFTDGTARRFGEKLRAARQRAGITQKNVGDRLGVTKVQVYYWETGKLLPMLYHVEALARAVRVPLEELLDWL